MDTKVSPLTKDDFFRITLRDDPDATYAAVLAILDGNARRDEKLEQCSELIAGFGVESVELADGAELLYVNKGDTYDATLCYVKGRGFFVSSWGDEYEASCREREESEGERQCAYCSTWNEEGEVCGSCGHHPDEF